MVGGDSIFRAGTALVCGFGSEAGGGSEAEEEAKKRKRKQTVAILAQGVPLALHECTFWLKECWLKEYHGLGGEHFCSPETSQKLNPLESPGGGNIFFWGKFLLRKKAEEDFKGGFLRNGRARGGEPKS